MPCLRLVYAKSGKRSFTQSVKSSLPIFGDALAKGQHFKATQDLLREVDPDVVIVDSEIFTQRAAASLGIPVMSFDHYGVLPTVSYR